VSTRTVRFNFRFNGALTDVTSAVLSDATAAYGVKRDDTSAVVVAAYAAMTKVDTGQYSYTFTEPVENLAYTAWVKAVYAGNTYYEEVELESVATEDAEDLTVTYSVLRRMIGREAGYGRNPGEWSSGSDEKIDVDDFLKIGVRRAMFPPPLPGEKHGHQWSFLRPSATFVTTVPYTTGTVTIASGVVTLVGGTWPSWATQGLLSITGGSYSIASRTSNSEIVLTDTSVTEASAITYSLGRVVYDLPSDFAMIDGPLVYAAGQSILQTPIQRVSEHDLLQELCFLVMSGYPRRYAIRPKAIDMTTNTRYELLLSPSPDAVYTLYYNYRIDIPALDNTNAVPPGGDAHGELYIAACLMAVEEKLHDGIGKNAEIFMRCLAASVSHDRKVAAPDTLGYDREPSDGRDLIDMDTGYVTGLTRYNGYPP
jgi:hypothetical protein